MKEFRNIHHLEINGVPFAEVAPAKLVMFFGVNHEDSECFNVEEIRRIRDWLTQALPCEHKGSRSGTVKWNEATIMTCNECGAEVPAFYSTQN